MGCRPFDAPDVAVLARFYAELRGWAIHHLDDDDASLDAETERAVALGATPPTHQPQDNVRDLLDPAGHPFCLYTG